MPARLVMNKSSFVGMHWQKRSENGEKLAATYKKCYYDNAPHHPEVVTFPDHKHLPTGLVESVALHFADVFVEIEAYVLGIT